MSPIPPRTGRRLALALLAGTVACVPSMRASYREGSPLMARALDARDLAGIRLEAAVGDVELRGTGGDSVRVHVALHSGDAERLANECIPKSSLEARREGATLVLRVEQRTRNQCGARWRVELPAALHARVRADVGDVVVHGLTGGLDVAVTNGDIDVTTRSAGHGAVSVRSDVGRARACVQGYEVPASSRRGAGMSVELRREGGPVIALRTRVGRATLRLDGEGAGEACGAAPPAG